MLIQDLIFLAAHYAPLAVGFLVTVVVFQLLRLSRRLPAAPYSKISDMEKRVRKLENAVFHKEGG